MSKVSCYFNLHKKVFSVKQGRAPVEHFSWLLLRACSFHVRESGRQRVLLEKRKNVHSFVRGELVTSNKDEKNLPYWFNRVSPLLNDDIRIRYNPYLYGYFFEATTLNPVYSCDLALLFNKQIFNLSGYSIL